MSAAAGLHIPPVGPTLFELDDMPADPLAVSRSIVEAHGGRLWAENNNTGGAIFNVALPLAHASLTAA